MAFHQDNPYQRLFHLYCILESDTRTVCSCVMFVLTQTHDNTSHLCGYIANVSGKCSLSHLKGYRAKMWCLIWPDRTHLELEANTLFEYQAFIQWPTRNGYNLRHILWLVSRQNDFTYTTIIIIHYAHFLISDSFTTKDSYTEWPVTIHTR
jgi:hypothetical protein